MVLRISPFRSDFQELNEVSAFTSVDDIGKTIAGKKVGLFSYLRYERAVVSAATSFLYYANFEPCFESIEVFDSVFRTSRQLEKVYKIDQVGLSTLPENGVVDNIFMFQDLVRLVLRECLWLKFISGRRRVCFGYDLYTYFSGGRLNSCFLKEFKFAGMKIDNIRHLPYS